MCALEHLVTILAPRKCEQYERHFRFQRCEFHLRFNNGETVDAARC